MEKQVRWSTEMANAWYEQIPWLVGCNYIPSTATNQLEIWQAETFDLQTIERELGWAQGLGLTPCAYCFWICTTNRETAK